MTLYIINLTMATAPKLSDCITGCCLSLGFVGGTNASCNRGAMADLAGATWYAHAMQPVFFFGPQRKKGW